MSSVVVPATAAAFHGVTCSGCSSAGSTVVVVVLISKDYETPVFVIEETRILSWCAFRPQIPYLSII